MGYGLEYTSQIGFNGDKFPCIAYGQDFGDCSPLNAVLHKVFTGVCTLLNGTLDQFANVGGGSEWYVDASSDPYNIRTFITGAGLGLTVGTNEINLYHRFISGDGSVIFNNSGSNLDIKASGGGNFQNVGTGTGEIYYQFLAGVFQMRRILVGQSLISEVDDKGFLTVVTDTDEVKISERKGG